MTLTIQVIKDGPRRADVVVDGIHIGGVRAGSGGWYRRKHPWDDWRGPTRTRAEAAEMLAAETWLVSL